MRTRVAVYLFEHLDEIRQAVQAAPRVAIFLDYDGTLTPIAPTYQEAYLSGEVRALLRALSRKRTISSRSARVKSTFYEVVTPYRDHLRITEGKAES